MEMCGNRAYMDGENQIDLGELSITELIDLLHRIADEIMLREMQNA